ncbi:PREDICTED: gelsolin-like protein 2 [Amphimedon queenslandica]|uniref:Gelsolin-like domain-containing protein n=1 Tax=Amphimedon queenslandica TaxID=400682 RepID=A0A1X7U5Q4_AMPQE|nr:PREDICTED: gelsolin-like protein 2 [Amphimedon queenslandica]|eukprot:XP_003388909.1 PREDICTED: gelsolin-like protein 2 [Amphimedon queenslandica]
MIKAKKYDWKDSNMALFGSDTEKQVKKESAQTEKAWQGAGEKVGIQIWRIVKFKVEHWPKEEYGSFYSGDSYIILNTYKEEEEIKYDVHFWIGQYSSQDEYGTAAYKTVELDTLLDDKPIQHREVQSYESALFKSYFPAITIMRGGAESGFRHVEINKQEYPKRLLHFHGDKKGVIIKEVPFAKSSIDETDVFILDKGTEVYLWYGKACNKDEKFKAIQHLQTIKSNRSGRVTTENIDQRDDASNRQFMALLPDTPEEEEEESEADNPDEDFQPTLLRVSDASGTLERTVEHVGSIPEDKLDPNDVFICDTGKECYVWIGRGASDAENKNAIPYAHAYLQSTKHPLVPVTCIKDGQTGRANQFFAKILS